MIVLLKIDIYNQGVVVFHKDALYRIFNESGEFVQLIDEYGKTSIFISKTFIEPYFEVV